MDEVKEYVDETTGCPMKSCVYIPPCEKDQYPTAAIPCLLPEPEVPEKP